MINLGKLTLAALFLIQALVGPQNAHSQNLPTPNGDKQTSAVDSKSPSCSSNFASPSQESLSVDSYRLDTLLAQLEIQNPKIRKLLDNQRVVERWSESRSSKTLLDALNRDMTQLASGQPSRPTEINTKDFRIKYWLSGTKRKTLEIAYFQAKSEGVRLDFGKTSDTLNTSFIKLISTLLTWSNEQVYGSPQTDSITIRGANIVNARLLEFAKDFGMRRTLNMDTRVVLAFTMATLPYTLILSYDYILKSPMNFATSILITSAVLYPVVRRLKYDIVTTIDLKRLRKSNPN